MVLKRQEVLVITGWKYPLIWISSQFPLFPKIKVFVVYIMRAGVDDKERSVWEVNNPLNPQNL